MTALTVSDIFTRVQRTFGDEAAVQVTEDDVLRWVNDAQQEAVNQIPKLLPVVGYLNTAVDQYKYTLPSNLYVLGEVYYMDTRTLAYLQLKYFSLYEFSQQVDGWDGNYYSNGIPVIYTKEADQLIIFPKAQEGITNGLKLHYGKYPNIHLIEQFQELR